MMKDNLYQSVKQTVAQYQMIDDGDYIVVGVSGGADSMALLHALLRLQQERPFTLAVAHVNHRLRGQAADEDQALVENYCRKRQVECFVKKADILALSRQAKQGTEEFARKFRYDFFGQVAGQRGKIATAHTADDNAETVLLHLVRGTGVTGLGGIPPVGQAVRPLIACSRQQVEAYCQYHQIPFCVDATNLQDDYRRNQIRHHIIPLLKQQNPSFLQAVTRMTEANRQDSAYLMQTGRQLLSQSRCADGYDCSVLRQAHSVVLTYGIKALFQQEAIEGSARHIQAVCRLIEKGFGGCSLPCGREAQVSADRLRVIPRGEQPSAWEQPIALADGCYTVDGRAVRVTVTQNTNVHSSVTYNQMDCDTIGTQLVLRNRRAGDTITLPGRPAKSLKKLMNEEKIPVWERSCRLILADENGVLWIEGLGCDVRVAPTAQTKRIFTITNGVIK